MGFEAMADSTTGATGAVVVDGDADDSPTGRDDDGDTRPGNGATSIHMRLPLYVAHTSDLAPDFRNPPGREHFAPLGFGDVAAYHTNASPCRPHTLTIFATVFVWPRVRHVWPVSTFALRSRDSDDEHATVPVTSAATTTNQRIRRATLDL
jgi:hypothetical protein